MSYTPTPPIWGFNDGYSAQLFQLPRHDNLSVSSDITTQYSAQNWFQFAAGADSLSSRTFNCDVDREGSFTGNNQEEEMSEGIRALLEITKNVKNDSKFEGIPYTRSQDSMSERNVFQRQHQNGSNHRALQVQHHQQQQQSSAFRITGLPHATQHQPLATKNTNYAMAVKKTLEPKKAPNVVYRQQQHHQQKQKSEPPPSQEPTTQEVATEAEPLTWFDKNGRRTVNAKEMEGGPKINGRSIVNGINLNSLKFVKPSRQCPKWDISKHRIEEPNCALWHPRERCQYYPRCRLTAEVCGFGHPFCCDEGQYCKCAPDKRSLQLNHLLRKDVVDVLPIRQKAHSG